MPNDHLIQDAELFMSTREGAFNTPVTTAASYERITWQNGAVIIPEPVFSTDAGRAGNANGLQTGQCLKRFPPNTIGIADRASFKSIGKLAMRWAGGTPAAPVTVAGVATRHSAPLISKAQGLQLPSFNVIAVSGGASFLFPGTVVNDFSMSQSGDEDVQVSFSLLTSGKHRSPHLIGTPQVETATAVGTITLTGNAKVTVTSAIIAGSPRIILVAVTNADTASVWAGKVRTALSNDVEVSDAYIVSGAGASIVLTARHTAPNDTTLNIALDNDTCTGITPAPTSANTTAGVYTLPDPPTFTCLDSKPFLEYTDDVGLRDLASDCRWRRWSFTGSANHDLAAAICGGDPRQLRGDYSVTTPGTGVGHYANKSVRGQHSLAFEVTYLVSRRIREWEQMCDSIQLTNLKFGARGAVLDAGAPTYEELSIVVPKAKFNGVRGANEGNFAAFTFSFVAEHDATTNGAKIEVVNNLDGITPVFN
jgi:hypothetical protein